MNRIHAGASFAICVLALFASCRQKAAVPLDKCGIVDAILNHKMSVRGEPEARRVRPADDPCIQVRALLHGKILVDPIVDGKRLFRASESCQTFAVYDPSLKVPDLPPAVIRMELAHSGTDAFHWNWWLNSITNPSGGYCAPGNGRLELRKNTGKWETVALPPEPFVP